MDLTSPLFFSGVLRLGTAIVLYFTPVSAYATLRSETMCFPHKRCK